MPRAARRSIEHGLQLGPAMVEEMRLVLPSVGDQVVAAIIDEVPSYAGALSGPMGATIRNAVQLALGGFISLAARPRGADLRTPAAPAMEGAYQLGRGEARSGRSMDALLAAYRIGARVSWRELAASAVRADLDTETLASFAELVFTYIDELSAASASGHTDELATSGRVRERLLERLCLLLVHGEPEQVIRSVAEQVDWAVPDTLTAVLAPASRARGLLMSLPNGTLLAPQDLLDEERTLLLVPDAGGVGRGALLRTLHGTKAIAGPARPWLDVAASFARARQAHDLQIGGTDTEAHLARLVREADPDALADLRARVLAPLASLAAARPGSAEKLTDTLRAWLLHQGRREDIATALFVHPQTVRYRMGQLREVYGEQLTDPTFVLEATIALG